MGPFRPNALLSVPLPEPVPPSGSEWTDRNLGWMAHDGAGRVFEPLAMPRGRMVNPEYMQLLVQRPQTPRMDFAPWRTETVPADPWQTRVFRPNGLMVR